MHSTATKQYYTKLPNSYLNTTRKPNRICECAFALLQLCTAAKNGKIVQNIIVVLFTFSRKINGKWKHLNTT